MLDGFNVRLDQGEFPVLKRKTADGVPSAVFCIRIARSRLWCVLKTSGVSHQSWRAVKTVEVAQQFGIAA